MPTPAIMLYELASEELKRLHPLGGLPVAVIEGKPLIG